MPRRRVLPPELLGSHAHRPWPLPRAPWIQRQSWLDFPFLHWTVPPDAVRPLVPEPLELDLADGVAWIGVIPFRMTGVTLRGFPDLPGFSAFHELNVRTYVRWRGRAGVYFLSLDADQWLAVRLARAWYGLPYWDAVMRSTRDGDVVRYVSRRVRGVARFEAELAAGAVVGPAAPGTLEHFLCERYALFVVRGGHVLHGDVHHPLWVLGALEAQVVENTMGAPLGLDLVGPPVHRVHSAGVDTVVWPLVRVP